MFMRRRCVVCGLHVRRSDFRVTRVLVGGPLVGFGNWVRRGVAHRGCVVVSDAGLRELLRGGR